MISGEDVFEESFEHFARVGRRHLAGVLWDIRVGGVYAGFLQL